MRQPRALHGCSPFFTPSLSHEGNLLGFLRSISSFSSPWFDFLSIFFMWEAPLKTRPWGLTASNISSPLLIPLDLAYSPGCKKFHFQMKSRDDDPQTMILKAVSMGWPMRPLYEVFVISTTVNDALIVDILGASPMITSSSVIPTR
ncbi:hypothetical protein LIER_40791 [Lithospermum erythrorhizon]|uniref:Uncharacterized protein n=1 Tax=Lithospermum erythrorhizon TaxID=34254 RepID=A0AAV3R3R3_LITER